MRTRVTWYSKASLHCLKDSSWSEQHPMTLRKTGPSARWVRLQAREQTNSKRSARGLVTGGNFAIAARIHCILRTNYCKSAPMTGFAIFWIPLIQRRLNEILSADISLPHDRIMVANMVYLPGCNLKLYWAQKKNAVTIRRWSLIVLE